MYYKQFIDNSSDQSNLFRTSKKLLNIQTDKTLPPHSDAYTLANEMGQFFAHKITVIRTKLADQPVVSDAASDFTATVCSGAFAFSESAPLSEEVVTDMVSASKKSCAFDPLSSSIFLSVWMRSFLLLLRWLNCRWNLGSLLKCGRMP